LPEVVRRFWDYSNRAGSFVLGFDTPTPGASSAGSNYPVNLIGHLGFTGTSFWVDPRSGLGVILLTNRVNLGQDHDGIKSFRPLLHDLIWENFG
jgi:CubicO group peptidase (beta-lactamase class C family)